MGFPAVRFEFTSRNLRETEGFYSQLFGWKFHPVSNLPYSAIDTATLGGIPGGAGRLEDGRTPGTTLYVEVPSVTETLRHAEMLGGTMVRPATLLAPGLVVATFQDREGRLVGICNNEPSLKASERR